MPKSMILTTLGLLARRMRTRIVQQNYILWRLALMAGRPDGQRHQHAGGDPTPCDCVPGGPRRRRSRGGIPHR